MSIFRKSLLLGASTFTPMGICAIEGEGGESAGGGGSSADASQGGGAASEPRELTTEEKLEVEFGQRDAPGKSKESSADEDDGDDNGDESDADSDEDGDDGDASDDGDESGDDKGEADADAAAVLKSKEVEELTRRASEAERDRDAAYEQLRAKGIDPESAAGDDVKVPEEPDASKYEFGENDLDYIKDLAKYDAKMEVLQENAEARFKAEAANLDAKWTKNLVGAVAKYPDFNEVVVKGGQDNKWACPPVIAVAIKDSEYGPDVAYELAKNPDEAKRISKLSPLEQAREFGRMEERNHARAERVRRKAEADSGHPKPRIVSRAPEPPKRHVRGGGSKHGVSADTDDFVAFDRMADKLIAKKSG